MRISQSQVEDSLVDLEEQEQRSGNQDENLLVRDDGDDVVDVRDFQKDFLFQQQKHNELSSAEQVPTICGINRCLFQRTVCAGALFGFMFAIVVIVAREAANDSES